MSEFRRRLMMAQGGARPLPSGYERVYAIKNYVTQSAIQVLGSIRTDNISEINITAGVSLTSNFYSSLFGVYRNEDTQTWRILLLNNYSKKVYFYNGTAPNIKHNIGLDEVDFFDYYNLHNIKFTTTQIVIDEVSYPVLGLQGDYSNNPMYLFSTDYGSVYSAPLNTRIKSISVKDNSGQIILDAESVRNVTTGEIGYWDFTQNRFITAPSSLYIVADERPKLPNQNYKAVKYLRAIQGKESYIDTGKPFHSDWTYKVIFRLSSGNPNTVWGLAEDVWNTAQYVSFSQSGTNLGMAIHKEAASSWNNILTKSGDNFICDWNEIILNADNNELIVNGKTTSFSRDTDFVSRLNIGLFRQMKPQGVGGSTGDIDIAEFIVSDNTGEIVQHLIPCYRKTDNKPGMYDTVTGNFLTNPGVDEFTLGPEA